MISIVCPYDKISCRVTLLIVSSITMNRHFPLGIFFLQMLFSQPLKFQHIGIEQGLSQSSVMTMLQDNEGFLWIGTWDGLNRYDGYSFKQYRNDPQDTSTLYTNNIFAHFEDHEGNLWTGTSIGGFARYNKRDQSFVRYFLPGAENQNYSNLGVISINQDSLGHLLVVSGNGVFTFDVTTKKISRLGNDSSSGGKLFKLKDNSLWLLKQKSLTKYLPGGSSIDYDFNPERLHLPRTATLNNMFEDRNGILWIASIGGGVLQFDEASGNFLPRFIKNKESNSLTDNNIRIIFRDSFGRLWIGTENGLNKAIVSSKDPDTIVGFERIYHSSIDPHSLNGNLVNMIFEDKSGVVWIGTNIGLNKLLPERKIFSPLRAKNKDAVVFHGSFPVAILEESDSLLWIGSTSDLFCYNKRTRNVALFNQENSNLSSDAVYVLLFDRKNKRLWAGTKYGLNVFDRQTKKFSQIIFNKHLPDHQVSNTIYAIAEDKNGMLWVGTTCGLFRVNPETNSYEQFMFDTTALGRGSSFILSILCDSDGALWIGTNEQGTLRYDPSTKKNKRFIYDPNNALSIGYNKTMSIYRDRQGTLWLATLGGGLNKMIGSGDSIAFKRYRMKDGLPNDFIYGILEDNAGNLWLSTNNGISKFNPQTESFRNYTTRDGLMTDEYNQNSFLRGNDGTMYFGGLDGLVTFHPDNIRENELPPPIAITEFTIFNESHMELIYSGEIILPYDHNFFSFEFAALCYEAPENNQYAYRLEGLQKDWNNIGTRRYADFTNIDPGEYVFHVKGTNNDGVWNEKGISIKITIIPPFWATLWFRSVAILLVIGLISGGVRYSVYKKYRRRIGELEQQKRILEERQRTRDKIARDLHDDLASTVGSAGLFIETAKRKLAENSLQAREYLDKTSSILSEAEEAMSDIVWSVSPKHDSLQSLATRIRLVTTDLCRANGIGSVIDVTGNVEIPLSDDIRRGVYLIFKEILNNCLKHSRATMFNIHVGVENDLLIFHARDNGVGFSMNTQSEKLGGNGMNNIRKRAEEIGARITIHSRVGEGTTIELEKQMTHLSH